jgi:hypothetical protein
VNSIEHAQAMLNQAVARSLQQGQQQYRRYTETMADQSMRDGATVGTVTIDGEGEAVVDVTFPITFSEKPIFTAGLELGDNTWLQYGTFPIWSATVGVWRTTPAEGSPLYVGATLGVVVLGVPRSILHYRFQALSFTNPVNASTSLQEPQ